MAYKNKEDQKAYARKHYEQNKDLYKQRAKANTKKYVNEIRDYVQEFKSTTPCADCGRVYHYCVMDFDHVDGNKVANISKLVNRGSWSVVKAELEKCELVCSNCHRVRTFERLQAELV